MFAHVFWHLVTLPPRSSHSSEPSQQSQKPSFTRLLGIEISRPRPVKCLCSDENKNQFPLLLLLKISIKLNTTNVNGKRTSFEMCNKIHHLHRHSFLVHRCHLRCSHSNHRSVFQLELLCQIECKRINFAPMDYIDHNHTIVSP